MAKFLVGLASVAAVGFGATTVSNSNRIAAAESEIKSVKEIAVDVRIIREQQVSKESIGEIKGLQEVFSASQILMGQDVAVLKNDVATLKQQANRVERAVNAQ